MYICPTCGNKFKTESSIQKHFLACWKERNPSYRSATAPRSEDITTREVSDDIAAFFNSL